MALYIPHSFFHLARLLYVRPETFAPYYVWNLLWNTRHSNWGLYTYNTSSTKPDVYHSVRETTYKHSLKKQSVKLNAAVASGCGERSRSSFGLVSDQCGYNAGVEPCSEEQVLGTHNTQGWYSVYWHTHSTNVYNGIRLTLSLKLVVSSACDTC